MSIGLSFAQNGINQDNNRIILNVFIYWLLARFLEKKQSNIRANKLIHSEILKDLNIDFPSDKTYKYLFKILSLKMLTHVRSGFTMTKY